MKRCEEGNSPLVAATAAVQLTALPPLVTESLAAEALPKFGVKLAETSVLPMALAENAEQPLYQCMKTGWGKPDPAGLAKWTKALADERKIDPEAGLGTRLFISSYATRIGPWRARWSSSLPYSHDSALRHSH